MYNLSQEKIKSVEAFIGKIPDSMVKSHYEKWLAEVKPTERITSEQLEKFVSLAHSLPNELQNFPQSFAHMVKNVEATNETEKSEETKSKADLVGVVNSSISHVPNVSAPKDKEETLHNLGKKEGSKGGEKIIETKKK